MSGYTTAPPPGAGGPVPVFATAAGQYTLSGWWRRAGAASVDGIIVCGIALVLLLAVTSPFSVGSTVLARLLVVLLACLFVFIAALLYAPAMMARTNGRTLGRMATGIRVVRASGEPMTFGFAFLREAVVKWLLFGAILGSITLGLALLVDYLWPLWDEEHRALHDYVVNTRTVRS